MPDVFSLIEAKMNAASVSQAAIDAFKMSYTEASGSESGLIAESDIQPAQNVQNASDLPSVNEYPAGLLQKSVMIKLNGGLGTSMGLQKAKSLLEVKEGLTFLDIIAQQIIHLRKDSGGDVRCLLMNGFNTSADTLEQLEKYRDTALGAPEDLELLQNKVPKLRADTLEPVDYPSNPDLEWCPPGHADLYAALLGTGMLDKLLSEGVIYAFASNSDNLGAVMDPTLLKYFAEGDFPFLMEVTERTAADKKGGHLAVRASDNQLLLREVAQCPDEDIATFQDISKHRFFNTNNIWIRLDVLKEKLESEGGALRLPVIRNKKTVDPRDPESTPVLQLETAMGAAIECFPGSAAINVPRSRFAPVKATSDLFALRSDAYILTPEAQVKLAPTREGRAVDLRLSSDYKLVDSIAGMTVPSLIHSEKVTISGPVTFEENVELRGDVTIKTESGGSKVVTSGIYENTSI